MTDTNNNKQELVHSINLDQFNLELKIYNNKYNKVDKDGIKDKIKNLSKLKDVPAALELAVKLTQFINSYKNK